ncbi:MAG TPA: PAS domain S-box protein [Anaerolineae bacterium]|nr:PAS domain S-box protein [Anaerolineae bacterium]
MQDWLTLIPIAEERDFISAVLDTAGALVVVLDREGQIVRFNKACERTTGYSFDEVTGKRLWDLFLIPEEVKLVRAVFDELRAGQFPNEYENYWMTRDGRRRLIAWSNTALLGTDGAVEYVIGTGIDVTERRQAEAQRDATLEALRQARDELERRATERTAQLEKANRILEEEVIERRSAERYAIFRLAVDPTHPYGLRIVLASPSLKELLGLSELTDVSTWIGNIHPDDLERVLEANTRSIETGTLFDEQYRVFKPERGEWDWVHNRSTPVFNTAGTLTHYNGLMVDITEQKYVEAQLRRQSEYLTALHETTLGVVSRLDISELLETIMERAANLVGAAYGFVYLVTSEEAEIEVAIGTGPYREYLGRRLKRGEGLAGKVYESGQPLAVEDYPTWPGRSLQFEDTAFGPALGAPLMSGEVVAGVLGVGRAPSASPFRQDEIDLIHRFSHLVAIALDNARLYSSVQQHLSELQQAQQALQQRLASEGLVARISTEFVNLGPTEVDAGIQHALQAIGQVAGVDRSYVFQFSGDGTVLDNTHEWCTEGVQSYMDSLRGLPRAAFPWFVGQLEQLEVVSVPRVADLPPEASSERAECEREGIQSIILVPLSYRGMLTGFLGFDSVRSERSWGQDIVALLKTVAGIIVNALEHKRAQTIQAGQRQFLELLATGGDFSETLHSLVRLIEDQWPGMLGLILLLDEDGRHLHIGASVSLPKDYVQSIEGLEIGPMVGSCGTACYRRERVIVEDTATDPRWDSLRDLALEYSLRACWSEPVFSPDGQVVGTFAMYYRQPRAPTEAELRTIEMAAHLIGVAIEHRRAEQALRESEEKFRGIVELANVGIAIVQDARFRFVNQHWASMLGYSVEELLGTEFMPYCTPEERDRIVDYYTRRLRGEPAPTRYETVMMHKDGTRVYADVSVGLIPYEGRQATFVFLRDITEQKRVEDALRQSELRFRAVFEGAPIGISVTSLGPQLLETNRALQQMFGYNGEEFYNLAVSEFSHPEDMVVDAALFDELVLGQRDGYQMEKRFIRKNGEMFWGRLSLSLVRGEQGEPLFAIATTEEITEQKQAQQALQEAYQTLEQRVEERTKELAALNMVSGVVSRSLDLNEIMHSALDKTMEVTEMEMGAAYLALVEGDSDGPSRKIVGYKLVANQGLSRELVQAIERIPLRNSAMDQAAALGRPYVWQTVDVPPEAGLAELLEREGLHFAISIPLMAKGQIVGGMNLGTRQPRHLTPESLSLLAAIGQQVGMAVENARLYEAEQDRREESEGRRRVAEGMREILAVLNSQQSLPEILDFIATQTCRLLGSNAAAILRLEDGRLRIQAACGLEADYVAGMSLQVGEGGAGRALAARQPVIISDLAEAAFLTPEQEMPPEPQKGLIERLLREYRSILSVPLIVQGRDYGAITVYYSAPREFSEEDLGLTMSVADQAALAIENARLREQAGQAAAMEERGRLARELHDSVTQSLYSVTMYTEAAARLMTSGQAAEAAEYLRDARDTAQEALREMRLMIYQLRPPVLEIGGLAVALQVRLDAVERRGGIHAELIVEGEDRLQPGIQAELHQIAQEALNNALKHAHAREVQVRLHFGDAATCLEVQDDGVGFELAAAQAGGGMGLPGIAERAQEIGARLEIETAPGQGTQVLVEVPTGGKG